MNLSSGFRWGIQVHEKKQTRPRASRESPGSAVPFTSCPLTFHSDFGPFVETPRQGKDPDLLDRIVEAITEKRTLLVLDGLECPWRNDTPTTEKQLISLWSKVDERKLALVVCIQGHERPMEVTWGLRIDVPPLSDAQSMEVFLAEVKALKREGLKSRVTRANIDCQSLRRIISALDGILLAIRLVSRAAALLAERMEQKTALSHADWEAVFVDLWSRWSNARSGPEKLSWPKNLPTSLYLALCVSVSLIEEGSPERKLLELMGRLPDGIADRDVRAIFGENGQKAAKDLYTRSLVVIEQTIKKRVGTARVSPLYRFRLETPIRKYVRTYLHPSENNKRSYVSHYLQLAERGQDICWGRQVTDRDVTIEIETMK